MPYKKVRKIITPLELETKGETTGDFLFDLRDRLYRYMSQKRFTTSISNIELSNGTKLSLEGNNIGIKLPKNKKIRKDVIEEILKEGTNLLLEENRGRALIDRDRMKVTMSLGDNTVYFTQGRLYRSPDGKVMPMEPILDSEDDTFIRVLDSNFTSDLSDLGSLIRQQHNTILGRREEDRTQDIADKLGFTTIEKDDSVIDVQINGVIDSCIVTRLCIHSNIFQNEKELLESIIGTYKKIMELEENPLVIIGLNGSIDITIGRDMNVVTIEPQYGANSEIIQKLIKTVIGLVITKESLENAKIEYNEKVFVEGESLGNRTKEGLYTMINIIEETIDIIEEIRKRHGYKITLGMSLAIVPLMFLYFLYNKINPTNNVFQAAMVVASATIFATLITRVYRKLSWAKTFGQKKFPVCIFLWCTASYITIYNFGFEGYLEALFYIAFGTLVLFATIKGPSILSPPIKWIYAHTIKWIYTNIIKKIYTHVTRFLSPITNRFTSTKKTKITMDKSSMHKEGIINKIDRKISLMLDSNIVKIISKIAAVIFRIVTTILGAIIVIIFAIAFIPMMALFVFINLFNRGYWRDLEDYREDVIEKAIHKYRDRRHLAPSCRVIFKKTKCKRLKNPLSGSWNVLRKKIPRLLTTEGFVDAIDTLVLKGWM